MFTKAEVESYTFSRGAWTLNLGAVNFELGGSHSVALGAGSLVGGEVGNIVLGWVLSFGGM